MAGKSDIEWTDATWNPVRGCTKVSPGCKHCYAEAFAERFRGVAGHPYEQGFDPRLAPDQLSVPLHWRKPKTIFVNSMSDLFGEFVPYEYIASVFGVMAASQWHAYQVLTKRSDRMAQWFEWIDREREACEVIACQAARLLYPDDRGAHLSFEHHSAEDWPLPNVWLGVSVEDRRYGLPRIEHLRRVPAAVRFLSIEPLLEDLGEIDLTGIGWVIVGGESGAGARPMHPDWVRNIREQCGVSKVPFFFKQWGAWLPAERIDATRDRLVVTVDAKVPAHPAWHRWGDGQAAALIGKKAAGRILDGQTWDGMPLGMVAPKAKKISLPLVSP